MQKSLYQFSDFFDSNCSSYEQHDSFTNCNTHTQYKNSYIDRHHSTAEISENETEIEDYNILARKSVDIFLKANLWKVLFAFLNDLYSQQSAVFLTKNTTINKSTDGLYIVYRVIRL